MTNYSYYILLICTVPLNKWELLANLSVGKLILRAGEIRLLITRPILDSRRSLQCKKISIFLVIKQMVNKKIALRPVPPPEAWQTDAVKHLITAL